MRICRPWKSNFLKRKKLLYLHKTLFYISWTIKHFLFQILVCHSFVTLIPIVFTLLKDRSWVTFFHFRATFVNVTVQLDLSGVGMMQYLHFGSIQQSIIFVLSPDWFIYKCISNHLHAEKQSAPVSGNCKKIQILGLVQGLHTLDPPNGAHTPLGPTNIAYRKLNKDNIFCIKIQWRYMCVCLPTSRSVCHHVGRSVSLPTLIKS